MDWEFRLFFVGPMRRPRWMWIRRDGVGTERRSRWFPTLAACEQDARAAGYTGKAVIRGGVDPAVDRPIPSRALQAAS